MGFVIGEIRTVKRHIKFELPSDDGKKPAKADLVVEFKVRTRDVLKARQKEVQKFVRNINVEIKKARENPDYEIEMPDVELDESYLREDIVNIEGCLDSEGNELPFNQDLLSAVLADRSAADAITAAWVELNSLNGAKRKN
jgi:hypothetical protein